MAEAEGLRRRLVELETELRLATETRDRLRTAGDEDRRAFARVVAHLADYLAQAKE